ncbi:MAG: M14 family zinc carboxypeptidase [Lysobacterales bacterium]
MAMRWFAGLLCLWVSGVLLATPTPPSSDLPEGQGPWVVRAYFSDKAQLHRLTWRTAPWEVNHAQHYAVVEVPNRYEYARLLADGFTATPIPELTEFLRAPARSIDSVPGYACYRTVEETNSTLDAIVSANPGLASVIDIGDSWEKVRNPANGYDLRVLKLSNSAITGSKPRVFIMGAIHAREYTTAETLTRYAENLIARYPTDPDVRWMLDHHELYLLPHANPDGRKKAELGLSWRKNVNEAYCGVTSNTRGADLNRNYPYGWGAYGGSSGAACDETFRGASAASEPETSAVVSYVRSIFPDVRPPDLVTPAPADTSGLFLDVHSYGELVMWPWGFTASATPNGAGLTALGRRAAFLNGYTPQQSIELYVTDGSTKDFVYGDLGIAAMSFELGTAFFENCSTFENTIWPANRNALDYLLRVARTPYLEPSGPSVTELLTAPVEPGETAQVVAVASDARFSLRNGIEPTQSIVGADLYLGTLPWSPGATPDALATPVDGSYNSSAETMSFAVATGARPVGRYSAYVRARDAGASGPVWAQWFDIVAPGSTGQLQGVIRNATTLQPIAVPALLRLGTYGGVSVPAQGSSYALRAPNGIYSLTVQADGFVSKTVSNVALTAPGSQTLDLRLDPVCTLFFDNASNGTGNFSVQAPWGVATNRYTSSPQSFSESPSGNYANNANLALTSLPLDLRDTSGLRLQFQSWCDTESTYDFGRVEISTDGSNWTQIWSCDASPQWSSVDLSLAALEGAANARIRFRFTSDVSQVYDGWNIDDIRIVGAGPVCGAAPADPVFANGFE